MELWSYPDIDSGMAIEIKTAIVQTSEVKILLAKTGKQSRIGNVPWAMNDRLLCRAETSQAVDMLHGTLKGALMLKLITPFILLATIIATASCDSGPSHWDNRTLRDYEHYRYTETYDCTTDVDCEEKYPCGDWYGNDLYDESMSEETKQQVFERCLDKREL